MSDFLQNLRNNSKDKKFNNRPKYPNRGNNSFPTLEKRRNDDRRNKSGKKGSSLKENSKLFESIRMLLEDISENQQEMLLAEEKRVVVEEKKLHALKNIYSVLEHIIEPLKDKQQHNNFKSRNSSFNTVSPQMETVRKPGASDRETIMEIISNMRNDGATYSMIAQFLDKEEFPTFSGKGAWHAQTVHRLCQQFETKEQ